MNYAVYAVGPDGQFGLGGRLPWGSLPEELEHFYAVVDKASVLVVGAKTYFSSPPRLRSLLSRKTVYIYGLPKGDDLFSDNHRYLTKLSYAFRKVTGNFSTMFIGGKVLLEEAHFHKLIDVHIRSTVHPKCVVEKMPADTYLSNEFLRVPQSATVVYQRGGNTDDYYFSIERIYL